MKESIEIKERNYQFDNYFEKDVISEDTRRKVTNTDILAIPGLYKDGEYYFAQETIEFIKFCRKQNTENSFDVLADGDIKVRSLHSFDIWLPIIYIASSIFMPVTLNLVSSYIWEKIKGREHEEPHVNVTILVKDGDKQKEFHYDGDAESFIEGFEKIDINKIFE